MAKVVINNNYGGFCLSHAGVTRYAELKGIKLYAYVPARDRDGCDDLRATPVPYEGVAGVCDIIYYYTKPLEELPDDAAQHDAYFSQSDIERDDWALVRAVEELGAAAGGRHATLKVVNVPDDVAWEICEYDGAEWVAEVHRTWS